MKRRDIITAFGVISLAYWCIDVLNNIFFLHSPAWSLWFSSVGIGLTAVGLLSRNTFLLSSLFCALFVVEMAWNLGFFSHVFFHKSFMGLTDYLFTGKYAVKDFWITTYHIVILPFILIALLIQKTVHKNAWIGAFLYTLVLTVLTYFFVGTHEPVNCVHVIDNCRALFFLGHVSTPLRILIGVIMMTIILFIPTNYILVKIVQGKGKR